MLGSYRNVGPSHPAPPGRLGSRIHGRDIRTPLRGRDLVRGEPEVLGLLAGAMAAGSGRGGPGLGSPARAGPVTHGSGYAVSPVGRRGGGGAPSLDGSLAFGAG